MPAPPELDLPDGPFVVEHGDTLSLHFDVWQVQSTLRRGDPSLQLEYTRLMMEFRARVPAPRRIAMIGLGGGAIARYCRHVLPDADFTAVERSPAVIALRDRFEVPPDGPRFRVVEADGAEWVRAVDAPFDVILVDAFDALGQPPDLCTPAFYADCQRALVEGGVLVVNLLAMQTRYGRYVRAIHGVFGDVEVTQTSDRANKIVFGLNLPPRSR